MPTTHYSMFPRLLKGLGLPRIDPAVWRTAGQRKLHQNKNYRAATGPPPPRSVKPSEAQKQLLVATGIYSAKQEIPKHVPPHLIHRHYTRLAGAAAVATSFVGGFAYMLKQKPLQQIKTHESDESKGFVTPAST